MRGQERVGGALGLLGQRLLLLVAQAPRGLGRELVGVSAASACEVSSVPIAYSLTMAAAISATRLRSSAAPVVIAPNTRCSAARPPSSTVM